MADDAIHHDHNHGAQKNIKIAFFLNLAFTLFEIVGGLWTNSMAILSDAVHDLGDSVSLGIAWRLEKYAERKPDEKFTYGYARFSLLGALISSLILVGGSVFILTRSIPRIFRPDDVNASGMLIFAIFGILVNGLAVLRLRKGTSLNEKAVFWHLAEDAAGWAAILAASIVLMFADVPILDPLLSVLITIYVLFKVFKNLKEIFVVFLQGVPENLSIDGIEREIAEQKGVISVHHTHIWTLEGKRNLLSTHIVIDDGTALKDIAAIKHRIRDLMKKKGIGHVTVEVDFQSDDCKDLSCD